MEITLQEHHKQFEFCYTRPPYRQGKEFKAVKVYTINDESQHVLIQNVPSIGLLEEIKRLAGKYGKTDLVELAKDYPVTADFTHVFYVKYKFLQDARQAKKRLDNRSFFGNILHVCYAPELETANECRQKLIDRFKFIQRHSVPKSKRPVKDKEHIDATPSVSGSTETGTWSHLTPSSSFTETREQKPS